MSAKTTPAAPDVVERLRARAARTGQRAGLAERSRFCGEETIRLLYEDSDGDLAAAAEITRLRARVAELEVSVRHTIVLLDDVEEESDAVSAIMQHCYGSLITTDSEPTPAPRDARITELEAALREVRDQNWVENCLDPQWAARIARRALGDAHG